MYGDGVRRQPWGSGVTEGDTRSTRLHAPSGKKARCWDCESDREKQYNWRTSYADRRAAKSTAPVNVAHPGTWQNG